jgi:hypothetical protein
MLRTVQASSLEVGTASSRIAGLSSLEPLEPGTGMVLDAVTRMDLLVPARIGSARRSATVTALTACPEGVNGNHRRHRRHRRGSCESASVCSVSSVVAVPSSDQPIAAVRRAADRARGLFVNALEGAIRLGLLVRSRTILPSEQASELERLRASILELRPGTLEAAGASLRGARDVVLLACVTHLLPPQMMKLRRRVRSRRNRVTR